MNMANRTWKAFCAAAAIAAAGVAGVPEARAATEPGLDAQNFKIALDPYAYMTVNGARALQPLQFHIFASASYEKNPLKFTTDSTVGDKDILKELGTLELGASVGLFKIGEHGGLQVGVSVPYNFYTHGLEIDEVDDHFEKTEFGDVRTQVKLTLMDREDDVVGVAARVEARWPSGDPGQLSSDNNRPSYLATVILEKKMGAFRFGAEMGYQFIESQFKIGDFQYDDKLLLGVGLGFDITENLQAVAEMFHWTRFEDPWDHEAEAPVEAGLAIKYTGFIFGMLGVNAGLNNGVGAPDYRFVGAVGITF